MKMELVKLLWINKTLAAAEAMGFQIAIVDTDGTTHGKLEEPKKKRAALAFPFGSVANHIKMTMPVQSMMIGQVYIIPGAEFGVERVRSTASSMVSKIYGKECHVTSMNRETDTVEIMRIA
jgi:hypothetical protein